MAPDRKESLSPEQTILELSNTFGVEPEKDAPVEDPRAVLSQDGIINRFGTGENRYLWLKTRTTERDDVLRYWEIYYCPDTINCLVAAEYVTPSENPFITRSVIEINHYIVEIVHDKRNGKNRIDKIGTTNPDKFPLPGNPELTHSQRRGYPLCPDGIFYTQKDLNLYKPMLVKLFKTIALDMDLDELINISNDPKKVYEYFQAVVKKSASQ